MHRRLPAPVKQAILVVCSIFLGNLAGCSSDSTTTDKTQGDTAIPDVLEVAGDLPFIGPTVETEETETGFRFSRDNLALVVDTATGAFRLIDGDRLVLASPNSVGDMYWSPLGLSPTADSSVGAVTVRRCEALPGAPCLELIDPEGSVWGTLQVDSPSVGRIDVTLKPEEAFHSVGMTFDLNTFGAVYGMGELNNEKNGRIDQFHETAQFFPLSLGSFERPKLTSDEGTNIYSPLWFTATGGAIFIDSYSFLDLSFNRDQNGRFRIHLLPEAGEKSLTVSFLSGGSTVDTYRQWVADKWEKRPSLPMKNRPKDLLFTHAIWTTWAHYHAAINQEKVLEFATSIADHGFKASYIEIDDRWTPAYGDLEFAPDRFDNPTAMVDAIHNLGFLVSAWVPPFINQDADNFQKACSAHHFVGASGESYPALVGWWNTAGFPIAGIIDFTSQDASDFWKSQVENLHIMHGVDGYKYDAGETKFLPLSPEFSKDIHENEYPDYYARWANEARGVEVRAGVFVQDLPIPFRQFDKDTHWGNDNGLASVLSQYLALGMIGYPFILPDMIGGNEYHETASDELFLRWTQLNVWLPMMQFSVLPWREGFSPEVTELVLQWLNERHTRDDYLLALADEAANTQIPMVRPLFFEFPEDEATYPISDEYMLGSKYLVAPVLTEGTTTRSVYLPKGTWQAVDDPEETHEGPILLEDYPAPLERIPVFFIKE